ncbi:MAG: hypothetical protein IJ341_07950 [Bacteroidales bacterium]|nr:hypothetical protein [Bacteroidales bacterium]
MNNLLIKISIPLIILLFSNSIIIRSEILNTSFYFNRMANDGENLWIATSKGIIRYNKEADKAYNVSDSLGIDNEAIIQAITFDKNNRLWFSIKDNGIYYHENGQTLNRPDVYIKSYTRYAFAFDNNDSIWTSAGGNYTAPLYNNYSAGYSTPDTRSITISPSIMDMEFDSKNNLWIAIYGEYNTLLCHKNGNSYCESIIQGSNIIPDITIDKNDNIWYCIADAIYYYDTTIHNHKRYWHDTDSNIPAAHFYASDIDNEGNVWFTSSHYLLRYDGNNFKWWNCFGYHEARAILCDNNIVWVLMKDDTLCKFENETFTRIDLKDIVTGIYEEETTVSNIKAYVSNGVLYVKSSKEIKNISIYDSMGRTLLSPNPSSAEMGEIAIPLDLDIKGLLLVKVNNEVVKVVI